MFSPDETPGRRRNWASVYFILALMGAGVLVPTFQPQTLTLGIGWTILWGAFMLLGYGSAAGAALLGSRKMVWLENAGSWLGNAGLSIYVVTLIHAVVVEGSLGRTPQTLGYTALLVIMVSRSFRLQRHLKTERRVKEIIRIANTNDTPTI